MLNIVFYIRLNGWVAEIGVLVKEYLEGKRVKVHKPISFLSIWLAILKPQQELYRFCKYHFDMFSHFCKNGIQPPYSLAWPKKSRSGKNTKG